MASWLRYRKEQPEAQARLFCFHHAGGSASAYAGWQALAPRDIEICPVQLPGRENRLSEAAHTDMGALVTAMAEGLEPYLDLPFGFFGHSMGARVAYALALELRDQGLPVPAQLIVSGSRAPHYPATGPDMHPLPDADFIRELCRLGGMPEEILNAADMMAMIVKISRADFTVLETYAPRAANRLAAPILALGGTNDALAPEAALKSWADLTLGQFRLRHYAGGHFYLKDHARALVNEAASALFRALDEATRPRLSQTGVRI